MVSGQILEVPKVEYNDETDYEKYVPQVIEASKWLIDQPVLLDKAKRKEINTFVYNWIYGCSDFQLEVRIELIGDLLRDKEYEYQQDLIMNYMAGITCYLLTHEDHDRFEAQVQGLKAVVNGYTSVRGFKKNRFLEKLYKKDKKGSLDAWAAKIWNDDEEQQKRIRFTTDN